MVLGGGHDGQFFEPTVIDGVTSAMRIAQEETFGPVAPIMTFDTLDEALAIANETEYGLTAAVFTRSLHDAWRAAEELRHGTVHINETTNYWDQLAPFGGAKKSGAGRELAGWIFDARHRDEADHVRPVLVRNSRRLVSDGERPGGPRSRTSPKQPH